MGAIPRSGRDEYLITCHKCKEYLITDECLVDNPTKFEEIGYVLSGLSRELFELKMERPAFTSQNLDEKLKHYLIPNIGSVEEKAKKLLLRFKERSPYFASHVPTKYESDYPLGYAQNPDEYAGLISLLEQKNFIEVIETTIGEEHRDVLIITADGWELSNSLKKKSSESEQGFIASWFDQTTNASIDAIASAIQDCGYRPMCIKDEHFSEKIMEKALGEIRNSRFVVIDLTGGRNSVFFEAGFSYGLDIDCIYVYNGTLITEGSPLDFYVKHYQCYSYTTIEELKEKVTNAINARIKK